MGKSICINMVCASFYFLEEISKYINMSGCKKANLVGKSNNYKYIQYSRKDDILNIYQFFYKNCNTFLERKKDKMEYILNNYESIRENINKSRSGSK